MTLDELARAMNALHERNNRKVDLYRTVIDEHGNPSQRIYRGSFMSPLDKNTNDDGGTPAPSPVGAR